MNVVDVSKFIVRNLKLFHCKRYNNVQQNSCLFS